MRGYYDTCRMRHLKPPDLAIECRLDRGYSLRWGEAPVSSLLQRPCPHPQRSSSQHAGRYTGQAQAQVHRQKTTMSVDSRHARARLRKIGWG